MNDNKHKFEIDFLESFDEETLLCEVKRVASRLPEDFPLSQTTFKTMSPRISVNTLRRRFGDWPAVLERAGLSSKLPSNMINLPKLKAQVGKGKSKIEIIQELRRVQLLAGTEWLTTEIFDLHSRMEADIVRARFGSFALGLEAASIKSHPNSRKNVSVEDCFQNLALVWTTLGGNSFTQEHV